MVDDRDMDEVRKYRWTRAKNPRGLTYVRTHKEANGRRTTIPIHRMLTGAARGVDVDHIDGNPLNNQRLNLRVCTRRQNLRGFQSTRGQTSRFRGVYFYKRDRVWVAQIGFVIEGKVKNHYLGRFRAETDAAKAFNAAATKFGYQPEALNLIN